MTIAKLVAATIALLVIAGCATPETRIYSIHIPRPDIVAPLAKAVPLAISLEAPRHLSQPYITTRTSPYEVELSRSSKWESSPEVMVREELVRTFAAMPAFSDVRLASRPPSGYYLLKVTLQRFERIQEKGDYLAEFAADVSISFPDTAEMNRLFIVRRIPVRDAGYAALAEGLSTALSQGMADISSLVKSAVARGTAAK